jgi:hypothetical protein
VTRDERDLLVEAAASAHRARDAHGTIRPHKAWLDLDAAGREQAFAIATELRALEAALDPAGLSTTGHAVLDRISRAR